MQRATNLLHSLRGALASAQHDTISQKELATLLGLAEPTMSRWMSGKTKLGQIELFLRMIEQLPEDRWQREIAEALTQRAGRWYVRKRQQRKR